MKVKGLILFPDMSFIEIPRKTNQNFVINGRNDNIQFSYGQSVFQERLRLSDRFKFWKRRRRLILWFHGSNKAFKVAWRNGKPILQPSIFTKKEAQDYVKKQIAKAKTQSPIGGWKGWLIIGLLILNLLFVFFRFGL